MSRTIADFQDDKTLRAVTVQPDGTVYRRVYVVPPDLALPEQGDPMPGETDALLGPFIEAGGISVRPKGASLEVTLRCKLLQPRGA
jgi:hypothetical protein